MKKICFCLLVLSILFISLSQVLANDIIYGDLDSDGMLTSLDVTLMQRYIIGEDLQVPYEVADLNGDGVINSMDLVLLQRFIMGQIDLFPVEEMKDEDIYIRGLEVYENEYGSGWSVIDKLIIGVELYSDRDYSIASMPAELNNATWIQTAMNSRTNNTLESYASFIVEEAGYVFIAHSDRIFSKPDWLSEYENTGHKIRVRESETIKRSLTLYKRSVSAGQRVNVGVNSNDGTSFSLMYPIIVTGRISFPDPPQGPEFPDYQQEVEIIRSGSTWSTDINGQIVYSGRSMGDAINAATSRVTEAIINIRNSGDLDTRINPGTHQLFDFHGNTVNASSGFRAEHTDWISIRNLHMTGSPSFAMSFHACSNLHFHNIVLELNDGGGIRVDNDLYSNPTKTTNLKVTGRMYIEGTRGHGFETYTIDGIEIEEIITRHTNYCGLILNDSRNVKIGLVDAYRANYGGGYAGFRVANFNGPNVVVDKLIARECGRGFFSVSGSHGTTINQVEITGSTSHGILIQNTQDTVINGGVVWNNSSGEAIRLANGAHAGGPTRDVTIQNLRVYGPHTFGIRDTTDNNYILNNDLRNAGSNRSRDLVVEGSNTVVEGNILTGD
ncbi:dockerin type I domain-containing protein [Natronospora cellulosivora (SeqCode)]